MRIVSGIAKGRKILSPLAKDVRPTKDRVREAIFNSLTSFELIEGRHFVDLFAGSGALGIEALSRGAKKVTFVDHQKACVEVIRTNIENLNFEESKSAFEILMSGKASEEEIYSFLTLLSDKGEVSDEIAGGVYVLREKSKRVNVQNCIDTCGTGGDGKNTLNISTASALLLASMNVKVAKHGNKAVSSKCGSGDVLEALNIPINFYYVNGIFIVIRR